MSHWSAPPSEDVDYIKRKKTADCNIWKINHSLLLVHTSVAWLYRGIKHRRRSYCGIMSMTQTERWTLCLAPFKGLDTKMNVLYLVLAYKWHNPHSVVNHQANGLVSELLYCRVSKKRSFLERKCSFPFPSCCCLIFFSGKLMPCWFLGTKRVCVVSAPSHYFLSIIYVNKCNLVCKKIQKEKNTVPKLAKLPFL